MSQNTMSPELEAAIAKGPPYPSMTATIGGVPTVAVDVPTCAVLLCLYVCSAVANMTIFQLNNRRGIKFLPSALLFGFSMARIMTMVLRISWACFPHDASLALAAQIFVNAGILIVYIINVVFAQRILRALQPRVGWNSVLRIVFRIAYVAIGCALVLIIAFIVYGSFTLSLSFHSTEEWVLRAVSLYLLIVAALPLILVPLSLVLPHSEDAEAFGKGGMVSKSAILLTGACLATIVAGFRTGTSWSAPRPMDNPAWYDSRAAFYCFNFLLELLILLVYTTASIDKRFHVPNGSSKRKTYQLTERQLSDGAVEPTEGDLEKKDSELSSPST